MWIEAGWSSPVAPQAQHRFTPAPKFFDPASLVRGFFVLVCGVASVRFRHANEEWALIKFAHLCISALVLFVPFSVEACSKDPPSSRAQFEREQNEFRILKRQYDAANQTKWWRDATEVQLVEVVGLRERRARLVRPVGWLKGSGTPRTLEVFDVNHYDPCPPTRGPLGKSRRGDLFIVFVFPRPATLSFHYEQTALSDVAIPQLAAALNAYRAGAPQKK